MTDIRRIILETVESLGAIKGIELVTRVTVRLCEDERKGGVTPVSDEIISTLNIMVAAGDLVEIEYVVPGMEYRIKSIYMPKGTQVVSVGGIAVRE
jgi:hypothetical protein